VGFNAGDFHFNSVGGALHAAVLIWLANKVAVRRAPPTLALLLHSQGSVPHQLLRKLGRFCTDAATQVLLVTFVGIERKVESIRFLQHLKELAVKVLCGLLMFRTINEILALYRIGFQAVQLIHAPDAMIVNVFVTIAAKRVDRRSLWE